jgi:hypothetical protein
MSFDGEFVTERPEFESIDNAWEYANNLGSKWYFYPFHFVIKNKTIKDSPYNLEYFNDKRIKTIQKIFNETSKKRELENSDVDDFIHALISEILVLSITE